MWKWEAEGQPKAVIAMLHGAYEHHRWYAWLIEKLRMSGFHIVMGDLPGHGEEYKFSRLHNEDFDDYHLHTKHLLKVAEEYNLPIFLVGNAMGGTLAVHAVQKYKTEIAGLVLVSPWIQLKKTPSKLTSALKSIGKSPSNVKITQDLTYHDFSRNTELHSEMQSEEVAFNTTITMKWYQELQAQMKILRLPEVKLKKMPVAVFTGGQDVLSDVAATKAWFLHHAKELSHFEYREFSGAYQNLFLEVEREEAFQHTVDFIDNCLRSLGYIIK
jgi:lysophospholipase